MLDTIKFAIEFYPIHISFISCIYIYLSSFVCYQETFRLFPFFFKLSVGVITHLNDSVIFMVEWLIIKNLKFKLIIISIFYHFSLSTWHNTRLLKLPWYSNYNVTGVGSLFFIGLKYLNVFRAASCLVILYSLRLFCFF